MRFVHLIVVVVWLVLFTDPNEPVTGADIAILVAGIFMGEVVGGIFDKLA